MVRLLLAMLLLMLIYATDTLPLAPCLHIAPQVIVSAVRAGVEVCMLLPYLWGPCCRLTSSCANK